MKSWNKRCGRLGAKSIPGGTENATNHLCSENLNDLNEAAVRARPENLNPSAQTLHDIRY